MPEPFIEGLASLRQLGGRGFLFVSVLTTNPLPRLTTAGTADPIVPLAPAPGPDDHSASISSTMLDVHLDRADPLALHEQVAAEIRRAIADGEAKAGERLPPARDLAAVLGVNANTVFRALRLLRDEGLLEFRRGRGVTVVGGADKRSTVISQAHELVREARRQGYRKDELLHLIERLA